MTELRTETWKVIAILLLVLGIGIWIGKGSVVPQVPNTFQIQSGMLVNTANGTVWRWTGTNWQQMKVDEFPPEMQSQFDKAMSIVQTGH
jgi:hypothetical protein